MTNKFNELLEKAWGDAMKKYHTGEIDGNDITGFMNIKTKIYQELIVQECSKFTDPFNRELMFKYFGIEQ